MFSTRPNSKVSQEPQDDEMQDLQPEEFELASLQLDDSEMEDVPVDDQQHSKLQSVYSPADDFKTYHPNFKSLDRHPMSSSLNSPEHHPDLKYFDPLSPSSEGSGPYHPDVDHLDTQASSPDGLPPYTRFPPIDGDISLPRIEIMAKEVFLSMARVSKNPT